MDTRSAVSAALEFKVYRLAGLLMLEALYGHLEEDRPPLTRPALPNEDHPLLNPWVTDDRR